VTDEDREPPDAPASTHDDVSTQRGEPRTLIERIGLAAVAFGIGLMFGGVGYAAWLGGELFLAVIGGISCVMTWWVGIVTLVRR
jgi:hypothetical protein